MVRTECYICGKQFVCDVGEDYLFKRIITGVMGSHIAYACSYTCYKKLKEESMKNNSAPKNRLRELRNRSRLTLQEVSALTGYDVTTISRYESCSRSLSDEAIIKFAALYKVETHELFVLQSE